MPILPSTSRSLPIALIRARESIMPPIREMLADIGLGITEQQWRVLRALDEHGPQNTSTLAYRACLLFPSLTRIAQNMREKGLITLSRDEKDRRQQIVSITSTGQKIINDNIDNTAKIVIGFKQKLGEERYEQLLDLLALLDEQDAE